MEQHSQQQCPYAVRSETLVSILYSHPKVSEGVEVCDTLRQCNTMDKKRNHADAAAQQPSAGWQFVKFVRCFTNESTKKGTFFLQCTFYRVNVFR